MLSSNLCQILARSHFTSYDLNRIRTHDFSHKSCISRHCHPFCSDHSTLILWSMNISMLLVIQLYAASCRSVPVTSKYSALCRLLSLRACYVLYAASCRSVPVTSKYSALCRLLSLRACYVQIFSFMPPPVAPCLLRPNIQLYAATCRSMSVTSKYLALYRLLSLHVCYVQIFSFVPPPVAPYLLRPNILLSTPHS
jgi:hypothetical protein